MKRKRYTEKLIISILKVHEAGVSDSPLSGLLCQFMQPSTGRS